MEHLQLRPRNLGDSSVDPDGHVVGRLEGRGQTLDGGLVDWVRQEHAHLLAVNRAAGGFCRLQRAGWEEVDDGREDEDVQ